MSNLSDFIESYLKSMLEKHHFINVQRNDLAEKFSCVPSQINYVLSTRFSLNQGFLVESRRGGGGYIKITKIPINQGNQQVQVVMRLIGDTISQQTAEGLISRLYDDGFLTKDQANLAFAAVHRNNYPLTGPIRDKVRSLVLKSMLTAALRRE